VDIHDHPLCKAGAQGYVPLDYVADARHLPFEDNSIEEVFTDRMIEHMPQADVDKMFREFYRVLVPGGKLDAATIDISSICRDFLNAKNIEQKYMSIRQIYGGQDTSLATYDYHCMGYDEEILYEKLRVAGFVSIQMIHQENYQTPVNFLTIRAVGYKQQTPDNNKE